MNATKNTLKNLDKDELIDLYLEALERIAQMELQMHPVKRKIAFNPDWTWVQKIVFILYSMDKPVLSSQIMNELDKYDDRFNAYDNPVKAFSSLLTRACAYNAIYKVKIGGFVGFHYTLPEWCNEERQLLKTYRDKVSLI